MNIEKLWDKALNHYQKGEYNDALNICRKILAKEPNDLLTLNMIGYIMFLNGDLESSKFYWEKSISNGCVESKRYLQNVPEYEKLKSLFVEALKDIKNKKVSIAIDKLLICSENDFNRISVGDVLEKCLLANRGIRIQFDYIDALLNQYTQYNPPKNISKNYLNKINKMNKHVYANNIKRPLLSSHQFKISAITVSSILICVLFYNVFNNLEFTVFAAKDNTILENQDSNLLPDAEKEGNLTSETLDEITLNTLNQEIEKALEAKDSDMLYNILNTFSKEDISTDSIDCYEDAEKHLETIGVDYFYKTASDNFKDKDFQSAITFFNKAFKYSEGHYLEPHILYFLGLSYEITDNYTEAIKYFEMYANNFPNEDYSAECLYKLVTLCKDDNIELAKKYAKIIQSNYSNSIYYNKVVKGILNNN